MKHLTLLMIITMFASVSINAQKSDIYTEDQLFTKSQALKVSLHLEMSADYAKKSKNKKYTSAMMLMFGSILLSGDTPEVAAIPFIGSLMLSIGSEANHYRSIQELQRAAVEMSR